MHAKTKVVDSPRREAMRIAGEKVYRDSAIEVRYPYTGEVVATVPRGTVEDVRRAFRIARQYKPKLTRYERYRILMRAGEIIAARKEAIAPRHHARGGFLPEGFDVRGGARFRRLAVCREPGAD
jgi:acyl-CoA reductase-like NAD-dependent aldehyde dehydrogenase